MICITTKELNLKLFNRGRADVSEPGGPRFDSFSFARWRSVNFSVAHFRPKASAHRYRSPHIDTSPVLASDSGQPYAGEWTKCSVARLRPLSLGQNGVRFLVSAAAGRR